jgi:hypothetical protein
MGKIGDYKNSFLEVVWIARNTLSTFWFWFPIIYMAYVIFQLWLVFYVSPLTLAILPITLIIYGVRLEEKRVKSMYGLNKTKRLETLHTMGAAPEAFGDADWKVEKAVEQYEKLLKEHKREKKE